MGSQDSESESPVHSVTIPRFAVGRFEITFDEWDACVEAKGCPSREESKPESKQTTGFGSAFDRLLQKSDAAAGDDEGWGRGRRPAINISWDDARKYVAWLSSRTGQKYRLLAESEWEYAARAGRTTAYWWGDKASRDYVNYGPNDINSEIVNEGKDQWRDTAPVGSFPPNPFGLYDMNGNAQEWTEDCYKPSYATAPTNGVPVTGSDCESHVVRGGGFNNPPEYIRTAKRIGYEQGYRLSIFGFRVARSL